MENKKEYCDNLYRKYKELREKTKIEVQDYIVGEKMKVQSLPPMECFDQLDRVSKEITKCFNSFPEEVLFELFDDPGLRTEIWKILMGRIKNNQNLT